MSVVSPSEFKMGSSNSDRERFDDEGLNGQHRRILNRDFAISSYEITVRQFNEFLKETQIVEQNEKFSEPLANFATFQKAICPNSNCPQIYTNWHLVARYCNWLSKKENLQQVYQVGKKNGLINLNTSSEPKRLERNGYRLPTEAEWEFAARANSQMSRYFGESEELLGNYCWYFGSIANFQSNPVGQKLPNALGMFDIYGNAWEWCHSSAHAYPETDLLIKDDTELDKMKGFEEEGYRILRGGGFSHPSSHVRSPHRHWAGSHENEASYGFRVARTIGPIKKANASGQSQP